MSAYLVIALACDAPRCDRELIGVKDQTVTHLMAEAGWGRVGRRHFCAGHVDDARHRRPFGALVPEPF